MPKSTLIAQMQSTQVRLLPASLGELESTEINLDGEGEKHVYTPELPVEDHTIFHCENPLHRQQFPMGKIMDNGNKEVRVTNPKITVHW
ncbi:Odorant-binding protein 2b [Manis javanica]|nr:Odorant-binding protein 2b [Manis javanica]